MNYSFLRFLISALLLVLGSSSVERDAYALDSFAVTIHESAGVDRVGEPVKVSLPFASGVLQEKNDIALFTSDGKPVTAQYEVLARWKDQSIRWLLVHFLTDVSAHGEIHFAVKLKPNSSSIAGPDLVHESDKGLTALLGPITIRAGGGCKDGFDVIDANRKSLFARTPQTVVYAPKGEEYRAEPPDKVELETNGPLYASVFLAGPMKAKQPGFENLFRWETRLHLWKGLSQVLAEHTLVAMEPADETVTIVDGIEVDFQAAAPIRDYAIGGHDENIHEGFLLQNDAIRLEQTCAFWHECFSTRSGPEYIVLEKDLS